MKNKLLEEDTPNIALYQSGKGTPKGKSKRSLLPSGKIFGGTHPLEFIKDFNQLLLEINCRANEKRVTQGELAEIAFYQLRSHLKGEKAPEWVNEINKSEMQ